MPPKLNHTIVSARDKEDAALFLTEMLGLEPPRKLGHFAVVTVGDELTLDYIKADDIVPQHYAFLVSENEFDEIFDRIKKRELQYWSDPQHNDPGQINHWDDGRGVYFNDPNGHYLEILTRSYGSHGTSAENPHPLVLGKIERANQEAP